MCKGRGQTFQVKYIFLFTALKRLCISHCDDLFIPTLEAVRSFNALLTEELTSSAIFLFFFNAIQIMYPFFVIINIFVKK